MIKKEYIILFLFGLLFSFYIYSTLQIAVFTNLKYVLLIMVMIVCMLLKIKNEYPNKRQTSIFIMMVLLFTFYPLASKIMTSETQIFLYSMVSLSLIIFSFWASIVINYYNLLERLSITLYISLLVFIFYSYMTSNHSIFNFDSILASFDQENRQRPDFGFNHPGTAGSLAFLFLINSFNLRVSIIKQKRTYFVMVILELLVLLYLINTGSRGAIFSTVFFFTSYYLIKYTILKLTLQKIFFGIVLYTLIFLLLANIIPALNIAELNNISSGRIYNWISTIDYLSNSNNLLLGLGYFNTNYFYSDSNPYNFLSSDNWFVYITITLGLIGVFLSILLFFYILSVLLRSKQVDSKNTQLYSICLFLTICYYSTLENLIFNPSMLLCLYLWIWIFSYFGKRYSYI
ncbi:O-antigen ligase family protein [Priestia megaterium]|uniref:O-antigen ligase family protein n=1 Tax=Priestia TaxID=2800373 RepID=UPI0035DDC645